MKLLLLSVTYAAACDVSGVATCLAALTMPSWTDKDAACKYIDSYLGCVGTGGCCSDTLIKTAMDLAISAAKTAGCTSVDCTDSAPCFARDTMVDLADGSSIPMSEVTAGDYVLPGPTRVIVNQHAKAAHLQSSLLKVEHEQGSISLTADHVLNVDGSFVAAREAVVGSKLGNSEVTRVTSTSGGIVNPLTSSGKIMADGVLASTYPEWIADYMLGRSTASVSSLLSFLFPATTQAYYDAHLEQFFQSTSSNLVQLKNILPAPLIALTFILADLCVAAGFVAFSVSSVKALVAFVAIGAALKSRK